MTYVIENVISADMMRLLCVDAKEREQERLEKEKQERMYANEHMVKVCGLIVEAIFNRFKEYANNGTIEAIEKKVTFTFAKERAGEDSFKLERNIIYVPHHIEVENTYYYFSASRYYETIEDIFTKLGYKISKTYTYSEGYWKDFDIRITW